MFSLNILVVFAALVCLGQSDTTSNLCANRDNYRRLAADPNDPKLFHICKDGKEVTVQSCPYDTVLSEVYQTCVNSVHAKDPRCINSSGQYANTNDKTKHTFIVCVQGKAIVFTCPANLVFDERSGVCVWDYQDKL